MTIKIGVFLITVILIAATAAYSQHVGEPLEGIFNIGSSSIHPPLDCLLVSGTTDCMLYQPGGSNIILVQ